MKQLFSEGSIFNSAGSTSAGFSICRVTSEKEQFMPLLLLADPSVDMVMRYLPQGELFALSVGQTAACIAVVQGLDGGDCELKNLATREDLQSRGHASAMVRYLLQQYAKWGYKRMLVGTSDYGVGFYRKLGFSYSHTISGFFTQHYPEPIWENGAQCVDMVYLSISCTGL